MGGHQQESTHFSMERGKIAMNWLLGRPRRRRIYSISMNLLEIELGDVDWIGLAQDRHKRRALVNVVMNFLILENFEKLSSHYTTYDHSSRA
jgi:hypothetical protein